MSLEVDLIIELDEEITQTGATLRAAGVPTKLVGAIRTRALRTGRRQTGPFATNRDPRWSRTPDHPQYGTEVDCKLILLRLYATLLEFDGAPSIAAPTLSILENRLGRPIVPNSFRDELTLEKLSFGELLKEAEKSKQGVSAVHIGHRDPTLQPKHVPTNVEWRTERSNLIQGNLTLPQARTKFVELIARYFELGEVHIVPDAPMKP
jgi:hypothetical protein